MIRRMICSQTALPGGIKETNDWASPLFLTSFWAAFWFNKSIGCPNAAGWLARDPILQRDAFSIASVQAVEALETTEKKKRGDHSTKWWPQLTENWWPQLAVGVGIPFNERWYSISGCLPEPSVHSVLAMSSMCLLDVCHTHNHTQSVFWLLETTWQLSYPQTQLAWNSHSEHSVSICIQLTRHMVGLFKVFVASGQTSGDKPEKIPRYELV